MSQDKDPVAMALEYAISLCDTNTKMLGIGEFVKLRRLSDAALSSIKDQQAQPVEQISLGAIYISPGISVAHELLRLKNYDAAARNVEAGDVKVSVQSAILNLRDDAVRLRERILTREQIADDLEIIAYQLGQGTKNE